MTTKPQPVELEYRDVEQADLDSVYLFSPKWYINGFPKSGTHLLACMLEPFACPMPPSQLHPRQWVGTFDNHSWADNWLDIDRVLYHFGHLRPGHFFKGHCGHKPEIETYLYYLGVAHLFVYRDFRDVAVSATHHALDDNPQWSHPDKELYRSLGSFDAALMAIIRGIDEYPGVMARWELYAPWLEVPWVLPIRFCEARLEPEETAKRIMHYGMKRLADIFGFRAEGPGEAFDDMAAQMVAAAADTERSTTFRRGEVGGWREVFEPEHVEAFKETDAGGWLVRLGFEESEEWHA